MLSPRRQKGTEVLGFFISLPVMFYLEGGMWDKFTDMMQTDFILQ